MGEGSSTPEEAQVTESAISSEPAKVAPGSRISRFSQWLRNFGKREESSKNFQLESTKTTEQQANLIRKEQPSDIASIPPEKLVSEGEQAEPVIEESASLPPRQEEQKVVAANIANILTDNLNKKSDIMPPQFENTGVAAIGGTNETVSRGFFEAIQAKNPDGYLIGVGVGNVFTLLHAFPESILPKGIVLADTDPAVVAVGKFIVKKLRETETFEDFDRQVHHLQEDKFLEEIQEIIQQEDNSILAQRLTPLSKEKWNRVWLYLKTDERDTYLYKDWNPEKYDGTQYQGTVIKVKAAMKEKFSVLKKLADSNNISSVYADFTNPTFIEAVRELPEFSNSTNIIYLSNIVDHITKRGYQFENIKVMEALKAYENPTKPSVFVDTLQSLNYFLRARNALPVYTHEDLVMPMPKSGVKPDGLIFAD